MSTGRIHVAYKVTLRAFAGLCQQGSFFNADVPMNCEPLNRQPSQSTIATEVADALPVPSAYALASAIRREPIAGLQPLSHSGNDSSGILVVDFLEHFIRQIHAVDAPETLWWKVFL